MTEGTPWKHILNFAIPVLAGSLLQQLYNTADSIIVGRYAGQSSLAGVGTTGSFVFFFLAIAIGLSAGNSIIIAQHYGAKDEANVRKAASTGILFLLSVGFIMTLIGVAISEPALIYLIGVKPEYHAHALTYFRWYCMGLVFQFGYNVFAAILRAVGDSKATLYFLIISSILNILLDLLFVKVFSLGVFGVALATDLAQIGSFVSAYIYMIKKYPLFHFTLKEYKWDSQSAKSTVIVGCPIALQLIIVAFGLTFIQRAVNGFGADMTASFTVGSRIEMYLRLPCNAFHTTLATYTGQNIGAGKIDRVKIGTRQTLIISLIMTLCTSATVWFFAKDIISLFGLGAKASEYCIAHLKTVAIINIILSMYIPLFGVFQGTNHSIIPTIVAIFALTGRVIATYVFRYSPLFGFSIVWWNGIFGFCIGFSISWCCYLKGIWYKNIA